MQNLAIVFGPFSVIDWFMDFFTLNRVQNKIHNIHQHFMKMVTFFIIGKLKKHILLGTQVQVFNSGFFKIIFDILIHYENKYKDNE